MRQKLIGKAVWCGPGEAGRSRESVVEFVEQLSRTGFNTVVMEFKGGHGLLRWPSKRFPDAVEPGYEDFDLPAILIDECHQRDMQVHAWMIDYMEGLLGPANTRHPEWAARNPHGLTLADEVCRGRKVGAIWMCPAQRPGYTDQWLVPIYEEFARLYDVDALHHDYIRYPGDYAPDSYCFCDSCLRDMPHFNGFVSEKYPDEPFFHASYDRGYLESHWEQSPKVLPANWDRLSRHMKSDFLLKGGFFQGGLYDLDYFFYAYRTYWVTQFARECAEAVRKVRPGLEMSAAVFKNPIHSGRFIGQDWRQFAPWVDTCMPMDYRDHYPGSFDVYLDLLQETIESQKGWASDYKRLWPGFAINFLYHEEERPLRQTLAAVSAGEADAAAQPFREIELLVRNAAPDLASVTCRWLETGQGQEETRSMWERFVADVPTGYWPKDKPVRVIERIRDTGVEGITIFCEGQIRHYGLWDVVREALA